MDSLANNVVKKKHNKKSPKHRNAIKGQKKTKKEAERPVGHNSKAFTFSGGRRSVHRRVQHASEVLEKRLHKPKIHKDAQVPPPLVVVVQGPKGVGKSTLITSLVKQFAKRNISSINGPITLVSSKNRRLTIVECGNSMIDMIDCSKIADIAIVMIDAEYGFEMETFEFVNMMQTHGFPRIIGLCTHLDKFKDNKTLRKTKKVLKKRFWSEIYDGAKMFYFKDLQYGKYRKNDVNKLCRYVVSQKPASISWRLSHPYSIGLRFEVIDSKTGDSNGGSSSVKCIFYGYIYGGKLNNNQGVHIPGAGDFVIESVTNFQDPCAIDTDIRTLKDKNRNIYAPYSDVGNLIMDDDAMYIQLYNTKEHFTELPNEDPSNVSDAVKMVRELQKHSAEHAPNFPIEIVPGLAADAEEFVAEDTDSFDSDDSDGDSVEESESHSEPLESTLLDEISNRVYSGDIEDDSSFKDFSKVLKDSLRKHWDEESLQELRNAKFINLSDENEDDTAEQDDTQEGNEKMDRLREMEEKKMYTEALELESLGNVGQFVKICISGIPKSFIENINVANHPIIIGGLQQSEMGCGFLQLKIKRHRWHPKILKTNDPLLFSVGWRRFQSLPVYCMEDRNQIRTKMLKYTPEHLHCLANIYGPISPPNFGILAIRNWDRVKDYRISASGVIIGTNQNFKIVKKLKLLGEPYKIMKHTAFIKKMFNSELEVIKCIGSKIQTASGIRGQIKKAEDKNGAFRATFEDRILMSDLVILKSYIPVETKRFFNLMVDHSFRRVKNISELRPADINKDSVYEKKGLIRRPARHFNEIKVPKPIIEKLPFSARPKVFEKVSTEEVRMDPSEHEKTIATVLQRIHTIRKHRLKKRLELVKQYKIKRAIQDEKTEETRKSKLKEVKKEKYRKQGLKESIKKRELLL